MTPPDQQPVLSVGATIANELDAMRTVPALMAAAGERASRRSLEGDPRRSQKLGRYGIVPGWKFTRSGVLSRILGRGGAISCAP
jgi:hypothetical protein